jgi:predicted short-subunit dehydrogenase-like oxidoreductase (DUF2520 family)
MSSTIAYDVAIVGAGRVGQSLGLLLRSQGHQISVVSCRTQLAAAHAVAFIGAGQALGYDDLPVLIGRKIPLVVLITTTDEAVMPMAEALAGRQGQWHDVVVLHCSGALSSAVLQPLRQIGAQVGSMHPLRAFGAALTDREALSGVHWTIEGDAAAKHVMRQLIADLGGQYHEIQPEQKVLYHAAASLAGNHLAGLLSLCFTLLEQCGIAPAQARAMLLPLSEGLLQRVRAEGEVAALAGPISRGDTSIVAKHVTALRDLSPLYHQVYCSLGLELVALARKKGVSPSALDDITALLQP